MGSSYTRVSGLVRKSIVVLASLVVAAGMTVTAGGTASADPLGPLYPTPNPDRFYHQVPGIDAFDNGDVVATRAMQAPPAFPGVRATLIKFRSTNSAGNAIAATGLLLTPPNQRPNGPLLSYQHIINGLGTQCNVSGALYTTDPDLMIREAPAMNAVLDRGWSVMLTDHLGPTSAYGAAKLGGQITLDGIRAAQRVPSARLKDSKVGLLGYSGGGMATGFAGALAPTYAPELNIVGVAQGGVPMNMVKMARALGANPHPAFGLAFAVAIGLEREYPDAMPLSANLNAAGLAMRREVANSCTNVILASGAGKSARDVSGNAGLLDKMLREDTSDPQVRAGLEVINENSLELFSGVPTAPTYLWHATKDVLIPLDSVQNTVRRYCAAGTRVQNVRVPPLLPTENVETHLSTAVVGMPAAVDFIQDRFDGKPAPSNC